MNNRTLDIDTVGDCESADTISIPADCVRAGSNGVTDVEIKCCGAGSEETGGCVHDLAGAVARFRGGDGGR